MNDKYLKESIDILNRKFGEPLPTLEDTTRAHSLKKEGGPGSGRKAKPGSAKDIDNRMSKAADDANARLDAAEKELKKKKMKKEDSLMENPAIAGAVAAMTRLQMQNPKTGKKISALTPLKNKEHPLHKRAKSMFQRVKDKFNKKKSVPKKQSKSDVDFYKRQFTGESINEANNMDKIKDIVKKKQFKRIGGVIIDMQTANAIMKVHKALTGANKKRYEKLSISKMADIAYKLIK